MFSLVSEKQNIHIIISENIFLNIFETPKHKQMKIYTGTSLSIACYIKWKFLKPLAFIYFENSFEHILK